jgi:starch-binding outer membrane protein, SusD/RagB family
MNKSIKYATLILGMMILGGCDAYLEENPDNRVELNTPEKAAQLLTNAYSSAGYNFTEWMSDNVTYTTGVTRLTEHNQSYQWQDIIGINQDTPTNFWNSTYDAIAHANEVLAVIDKLEGEKAFKDAVKGEAYLTRAYGHFMLVNLFAKHYDEESSRDDLGIPYVEEPEREFIKTYTRQSVREVYNKIEDDILDGLKYVDDSYYANSGKYHFNKNAALAFASRFFLFKGDYDECIEYSSEMLGSDPATFIKDIATLLETTSNPLDFLSVTTSPGEASNLLLIRQVTNAHVNVGFWPSPSQVRSLYNSNPFNDEDVRTSLRYPIFLRGSGWGLGKFEFLFERLSLTSNVGFNYTIFPAFRGEEVLLNRAESYTEKNQTTQAIADLQHFVRYRYEAQPTVTLSVLRNYYGTSNNQEALRRFIRDERQKEFMHEGLRWFDIKRFNLPVVHDYPQNVFETLQANDLRKVLQIPQAALDVGGLEPNPR